MDRRLLTTWLPHVHGWLACDNEPVRSGVALFQQLLGDAGARTRAEAAYALAWFPEHADGSVPVEEAAKRLTAEALRELERLASGLRREKSSTRWIGYRDRFYRRLYALADLPRTSELIFELRAEVGPYLVLRRVAEDPRGHAGVLEYLSAGDVVGGKQWLREHLEAVSKELQ